MFRMEPKIPNDSVGCPEWKLAHAVVGTFYETYNTLGFGFLESVYCRALAMELRRRNFAVSTEVPLEVRYQGEEVGFFRLDRLVEHRLAVELKASALLGPADKRQLWNYLRASSLDVGLLLHVGPKPAFHRLVSPRVMASRAD